MALKPILLALFGLVCWASLPAMAQKPPFKSGDRVCFVGNSITQNGEFHHNILLHYLTRYPKEQVTLFNCGVSGDVTGGILKRMGEDILVQQPNYAVIMIGMNDVGRGAYGPRPTTNPDTLKQRERALVIYKTNLDSIVQVLLAKHVTVILQKPSIYDQTALLPRPNNFGVNDALKAWADFIQSLSDKYKLQTVDYWTIMSDINRTLQQKDPSATIIGADRVHPGSPGHLVMAYPFLATTGKAQPIARICLNNTKKQSQRQSQQCYISAFTVRENQVQATVQEQALPFPLIESQQSALTYVPFVQAFNTELFQVKNQQPGTYRLTIDSVIIGRFSASQLAEGINLTDFTQTPQYQQALRVRHIMGDLWKIEADLRTVRYVEHAHLRTYRGAANSTSINRYLDSVHTARFADTAYIKTQFVRYNRLKVNELLMAQKVDVLRQAAYKASQPQPHRFVVERLTTAEVLRRDQSSSPLPANVHRVVVLGNSITYAGTYVTFIDAYFRLHYPNQPVEFINLGLPSETVSGLSEAGHADGRFPRPDLHERLSRLLTLTKPDLVIACYGMNDGIYLPLDNNRFQKFKDGINWLHDEVRKTGADIIHVTPPVYDELKGGKTGYAAVLDAYSAWLLSQQQTHKWTVIDIHYPMKQYLEAHRNVDARLGIAGFALAEDGVHPGEVGYWIMAKNILVGLGISELATAASFASATINKPNASQVLKGVAECQSLLTDAWLTAAGHKRPGMKAGLPLAEAQNKAADIEKQLQQLNR